MKWLIILFAGIILSISQVGAISLSNGSILQSKGLNSEITFSQDTHCSLIEIYPTNIYLEDAEYSDGSVTRYCSTINFTEANSTRDIYDFQCPPKKVSTGSIDLKEEFEEQKKDESNVLFFIIVIFSFLAVLIVVIASTHRGFRSKLIFWKNKKEN